MRFPSSGRQALWFGFAFIAAGAALFLGVRLDPGKALAPVWVVEAAAAAFILAGLSVVFEGVGLRLASRICSLLVVYLLAVPGLWTLFDADASCTIAGGISGAAINGAPPSWMCWAMFGGGGIVVLLAALGFTLTALLRRKAVVDKRVTPT